MHTMGPQRTCIGCRGTGDQKDLVRLVRVGEEVADGTSPRLPGRGAYLHRDPRCLEKAEKRRAISRALGGAGVVPPSVVRAVTREQQDGPRY